MIKIDFSTLVHVDTDDEAHDLLIVLVGPLGLKGEGAWGTTNHERIGQSARNIRATYQREDRWGWWKKKWRR